MKFNLKVRLIKYTVITCSILLALGMVEISVRFMHLAPTVHRIRPNIQKSSYRVSNNPVLGYVLKENYRDENPDLIESFPSINSHGQRDIERTYIKKKGVKRILVLGDSVVEGLNIYDLNDTITRRLEIALQDKNVEVLNFGIAGYSTRGEVELLKVKGIKYSPDLVMTIFLINDYFNFNSRINRYRIERSKFVEEMFIHWHFFRFISMKFNLFNFRFKTDPNYFVKRHLKAMGDNNVERGLELLKKMSKEHGFQTAILIWPLFTDKYIIDLDHPTSERIVYDDTRKLTIERFAEELNIPSFRLSKHFRRDLKQRIEAKGSFINPKKLYTTDGTHPSVKGAQVCAEAIENILKMNPQLLRL